jgi:hypothetical protein
MQKHVPFFIFLLVLSMATHAADNWDTPENAKRAAHCQDNDGSPTCNTFNEELRGYSAPTGAPASCAASGAPSGNAQQALEAKYRECGGSEVPEYDKAKVCCTSSGAEGCLNTLPEQNEGRKSYAQAQRASNDARSVSGGDEAACRTTENVSSDLSKASGAIAGACHARKMKFIQACKKRVEQTQEYACAPAGARTAAASVLNGLSQGLNPATAEQNRANALTAMNGGRNCGQASRGAVGAGSSQPGGGSSPGGRSAGNGSGSGSGSGSGQREGGSQTRTQSAGGGMNMGQMLPLAMMAMQMMNQQGQQNQNQQTPTNPSLDKVDCSVNANLAGCPPPGAAANDSWNPKVASIDGAANNAAGGNFNPADENSMTPASTDPAGEPKQATPVTVGAVPNGGGGMPGGGGGGAASLGGGGGGGGGGMNSKAVTDIMHGMGGGGGGMSAMAANMNMKNGEGGGGYTYGQGGYGQHDETGLDLSSFCPVESRIPLVRSRGLLRADRETFKYRAKK